jgi:transcriptional regulator with XRE-family HTH domain
VSQDEETYFAPVFQGATLKALRNRVILPNGKKLTLRALGDRLGVSFQAVGNWEAGRNEPEAHMLPMIARELGCQVGDLFSRTLPPAAPPLIPDPPADPGFLQEMLAALLIELIPNQSAEEAKSLAAKIVAESRTPPDPATGAKSGMEALIRVRTLLRSHKQQ